MRADPFRNLVPAHVIDDDNLVCLGPWPRIQRGLLNNHQALLVGDVEEMVDDPELRAEAARIRDRARGIRGEMKRHSQAPNWDLIRSG